MPISLDMGIYHADKWNDDAALYERKLGALLARQPEVKDAAQKTLKRLHDVLARDYERRHLSTSFPDAIKKTADVFFLDEPSSAGQIGTGNGNKYIEYLMSEQSSVREIMTAIFNATYFRSVSLAKRQPKSAYEDVSLKETIQNIYFTERNPDIAADLRLNVDHLNPYVDFLQNDQELLEERIQAERSRNQSFIDSLGRDVFALGCIALYRGQRQYEEVHDSYIARKWNPIKSYEPGSTTPRDYAALGVPLGTMERKFLGTDPTSLELSGFDTSEVIPVEKVPIDPDTGLPDLKVLWKEDVFEVCERYEQQGDESKLVGYILVKSKEVTATNIRQSDLKKGYAGPEFPLQWSEGWAYWGIDPGSPWYMQVHDRYGYRVVAAISGTTARMLLAFGWLNVPQCRARNFIKALMAWMLPCSDHSLYEIIKAADISMLDTRNETQHVPNKGSKRRLIENSTDQKFIKSLTEELENGAEHAYSLIEGILKEKDRNGSPIITYAPYFGNGDPQTPSVEKIYFDMASKRPPELEELTTDVRNKIVVTLKCIKLVVNYADPRPDAPHFGDPALDEFAEDTKDREGKVVKKGRMTVVYEWLKDLKVNGPDLMGIDWMQAYIMAIYIYTGSSYKIINLASDLAAEKRLTKDTLRDGVWEIVESCLKSRGEKYGNLLPQFILNVERNSELASSFRRTLGAYQRDSTQREERLRCLKQLFDCGVRQEDVWERRLNEARMHDDMTERGLQKIKDSPQPELYRGTWCLHDDINWHDGQVEFLNPHLRVKRLTSTSSDLDIAIGFARSKIVRDKKKGLRDGLVVFFNGVKRGSGNDPIIGKPIYGISQAPGEKEVMISTETLFKFADVPKYANPHPADEDGVAKVLYEQKPQGGAV